MPTTDNGDTFFAPALTEACAIIKKHPGKLVPHLVFLTDGENHDNPPISDNLINEVKATFGENISMISFHDSSNKKFLQPLADRLGVKTYEIKQVEDTADVFTHISVPEMVKK